MTVSQLKEVLAGLPDDMGVYLNIEDAGERCYDMSARAAFTVPGRLVLADAAPTIPKEVPVVLFPKEGA